MSHSVPIAPLFPLGGPVPRELIIGRSAEIAELSTQIGEGVSTLVTGPRRIGKTTVCDELCRIMTEQHGALVIKVDVPERSDSSALLQRSSMVAQVYVCPRQDDAHCECCGL